MNRKLTFYIVVFAAIVEFCLIMAMLFTREFELIGDNGFPKPLLFNFIIFMALVTNVFREYRKMPHN